MLQAHSKLAEQSIQCYNFFNTFFIRIAPGKGCFVTLYCLFFILFLKVAWTDSLSKQQKVACVLFTKFLFFCNVFLVSLTFHSVSFVASINLQEGFSHRTTQKIAFLSDTPMPSVNHQLRPGIGLRLTHGQRMF